MKKPDALRQAIVAALPELKAEPERLVIAMEKGRVVATGAQPAGAVAAFEYRYTLVLTLLDFAGNPDVLFTAILVWLSQHQRELLERYVAGDKTGIEFDVDILDAHKADVEIQLQLIESVGVSLDGQAWAFEHYPEPPVADAAVAAAAGMTWAGEPEPFAGLIIDGAPLEP